MTTAELTKRFKAFIDAMSSNKERRFLWFTIGKPTINNDGWTKLEDVLTAESKTKEQEIAALIEEKQRALVDGFTQQIEAQKAMITELTETIRELITSGLSVKSNRKHQTIAGTNEGDTATNLEEIYKQFFGQSPVKGGRNDKGESIQLRGIWVTSKQVSAMIGNALDDKSIKDIVSKLGNSTKIQVAYAANIRLILSHSVIKSLLIEPWKSFQLTSKSDENQDETQGE